MKKTSIGIVTAILSTGMLHAQAPPPPDPPTQIGLATTSLSGSITQLNYNADGRMDGFVLSPNTLVSLPPDWSMQMMDSAKTGQQVRVTGTVNQSLSGMQIVRPQTLTVAGRTLSLMQPVQPAPYVGSGVISQLNYGRDGAINGFLLRDGILARTPPFGASNVSVIKPGASVSVAGFARKTAMGKTVVDVQSITVNGQTIALNAGPGPLGGPGGRGPRGRAPLAPPAPPPAPPSASAPPPGAQSPPPAPPSASTSAPGAQTPPPTPPSASAPAPAAPPQ